MKSSPMAGDRKCYQLPPGSSGLAARAAVVKITLLFIIINFIVFNN